MENFQVLHTLSTLLFPLCSVPFPFGASLLQFPAGFIKEELVKQWLR